MAEPTDQGAKSSHELPAKTAYDLPEGVCNGELHYGVAITVTADGKQSTIMIPDASKISKGEPVYTTGRVDVRGEALMKFLQTKGVSLPNALSRLIGNTTISCDAFYYSTRPVTFKKDDDKYKELKTKLILPDKEWEEWLKNHATSGKSDEYTIDEGPLLMMFSIDFDKGLRGSLTGEEHLGELFDITGGSVRVVRCPGAKTGTLKDYVKQLQQIS
jgi:hypothetical protein